MRTRTLFLLLTLLFGGGVVLTLAQGGPADLAPTAPSTEMVASAQTFLGLLDDEARARGHMAFDSEERYNWHFIPRERLGLPFKAMTPAQRDAAHTLLQTALSEQGYEQATNVIELERLLGILENRPDYRDPENYYVTIFGTPSPDTPWGWRFEGHHLSLNFSSVTNELVTATPAFFGANPAEVPSGARKGWRLLAAEEDLGRTLLGLLSDAQRNKAVIAATAPRDVITGADRHARLERFEGLPASEMTPPQRDALVRLLKEYLHNMEANVAEAEWARMEQAGLDNLYFAWAGSLERGEGHYYRVHGPTLLLEYDNTQNDANHVHTVWRGFGHDFGEDLLRNHYEQSGHH